MLTVRAFGPGRGGEVVDADHLAALRAEPGLIVWADLVDSTIDEQEAVRTAFGLHELSVEDLRKHRQRPKVDRYADHVVLVAYGVVPTADGDEPDGEHPLVDRLAEVDVVVGHDWVLTSRERRPAGVVPTEPMVAALRADARRPVTPALVVHAVLDAVVDGYVELADEVDHRLAGIEDLIFGDSLFDGGGHPRAPAEQDQRDRRVQRSMLGLRNDLVQLRRRVAPLYDVLQAVLRGEVGDLGREESFRFQDVVDHVLRVTESIDVHHELLSNAFDAHLALVAQHTNDTMRRMTAWGSILLGATLIAGIYGMNFDDMPELRWALGYPFAIASMVLLSLGLWITFRRRRWL